nr:LytTR family DNA-binding domain-containing protein [Clostridioides sp.]
MYTIVICEDDLTHKKVLKDYISQIFSEVSSKFKIYEFTSGLDLINSELDNIDIYFLDIKMDGLSGMDTAIKIREVDDKSEIIFITSLIDYVQEGYVVRAYRYLVKPINYKDLKKHVINCIEDMHKNKENFMLIGNNIEMIKIPIADILYIEVRKKELTIHSHDKTYVTKCSMNKAEKDLRKFDFFRCHKSYLINLKKMDTLTKDSVIINEIAIPVSKHRINTLKKIITYVLADVLC